MNIFLKKKLFAGFLLFTILLCNSYKGGFTEAATGAPFEGTQGCQDCHSGGNYPVNIAISLLDKNDQSVTKYQSNTEYTIEVKLSGGNPAYYGFQLVPVDKDNKSAGTFGTLGTNVRKANYDGRQYIMQSTPRKDGAFTAKWTSPAADSVLFYTSGLAANGNNGSNGDKGTSRKIAFLKDLASNTNEVQQEDALISNMVSQHIKFRSEVSEVRLYDLGGKLIPLNNDYEISNTENGLYILHYNQDKKIRVKKIMIAK